MAPLTLSTPGRSWMWVAPFLPARFQWREPCGPHWRRRGDGTEGPGGPENSTPRWGMARRILAACTCRVLSCFTEATCFFQLLGTYGKGRTHWDSPYPVGK